MIQGALLAPLAQSEILFGDVSQISQESVQFPLFIYLGIMIFMVWAFRFMFVYVPTAANVSVREFARYFPKFMDSLYFIGIWLVCQVPFTLVSIFLASLFHSATGGETAVSVFLIVGSYIFCETLAVIVMTICFSHAIKSVMTGKKNGGAST
jgi:hypothetical protein